MREVYGKLRKYIEEMVLPEYEKNEKGHGIDHIENVIRRSFDIVEKNKIDVDINMVYVIAAYHDIGHHIDAKNHEVVSAKMLLEDKGLLDFFSEEEIKVMSEAVQDHRASSKHEPKSIYGKIVSTADRNSTIEQCFKRSYTYGKRMYPEENEEFIYNNAYDVLKRKFGENGYAKFFFKDEEYEKFLRDIRELLKDKDGFMEKQRTYIEMLREKGEL